LQTHFTASKNKGDVNLFCCPISKPFLAPETSAVCYQAKTRASEKRRQIIKFGVARLRKERKAKVADRPHAPQPFCAAGELMAKAACELCEGFPRELLYLVSAPIQPGIKKK
jgi:hypothetical protein